MDYQPVGPRMPQKTFGFHLLRLGRMY